MFSKPQYLLIITALLLFVCSLFVHNHTVDIHIQDTFYVLDFVFVFRALITILFILWLLYGLTNRVLCSSSLSWIHIISTIVIAILIISSMLWDELGQKPINENYSLKHMERYQKRNDVMAFSIVALLISQLAFFITLLIGLQKKHATGNNISL